MQLFFKPLKPNPADLLIVGTEFDLKEAGFSMISLELVKFESFQ